MANPIVTSLPAYVEQNRLPLLRETMLEGISARLLSLQTGIKSSAALNLLSTEIEFGDGSTCGWDDAGTQALSQRILTTGQIKINMSYCEKVLLGKWAESEVRIAADDKRLPFEEEFMNGVRDAIRSAIEKAIWQGDTTSDNANLNKFNGLLKILNAETTTIKETITAGSTYRAAVAQVLLAMPAETLKDDARVFVSPEFLRGYGQELVNANLYHYAAGEDFNEIQIPGSRVRLVAVAGLSGTSKIVAGRLSNMFLGVDLENASEIFDFWYSQDNREFRLAVEFNMGVQVAFPDEIVVGTYTTLG